MGTFGTTGRMGLIGTAPGLARVAKWPLSTQLGGREQQSHHANSCNQVAYLDFDVEYVVGRRPFVGAFCSPEVRDCDLQFIGERS